MWRRMLLRDPKRAAGRRRRPRRYSAWTFVAPVALIAAVIIVVSVIRSTLDERATGAATTTATTTAPTTVAVSTTDAVTTVQARRHRVRSGESLSSIAEDFDTTVDALTDLNPDLDPLRLTPGDIIKVR